MVSINDYFNEEVADNFGDTAALEKAMQAGSITGRETVNQSLTQEPLKIESLEKSLKMLEYKMTEIKLYNAVPKLKATNTVEEFLQLKSYGSDRGGFYNEGELSEIEDSTYVRKAEKVKYMQVTGEVTLQAQIVNSFLPAMQTEIKNKMMWILKLANKSLVNSDEKLIPQQFNSYYAQHADFGYSGANYASKDAYMTNEVVIDMRGKSLVKSSFEQGAVIIDDNHGSSSHFFGPSKVFSAFVQDYNDKYRILVDGKASSATDILQDVPKMVETTVGNISLNADKFLKAEASKKLTDVATSSKAPNAPTADGTTPKNVVSSATNSKFQTGEAGNVFYAVSAFNRFGESALSIMGTAAAVVAGCGVDLKFTSGGGTYAATGYTVYRTKPGVASTGDFYPIFKVSEADRATGYDGAAANTVRDLGYFLPDMEQCFQTQMDDEVVSFKELAPISKLDLAVLAMSKRFIIFLFGTPHLYAPKKFVRYINVSRVYNP